MFKNKLCHLKKKNSRCETAHLCEVYTMKTEINALEFSAVEKVFFFCFLVLCDK